MKSHKPAKRASRTRRKGSKHDRPRRYGMKVVNDLPSFRFGSVETLLPEPIVNSCAGVHDEACGSVLIGSRYEK